MQLRRVRCGGLERQIVPPTATLGNPREGEIGQVCLNVEGLV
jgi:hypothetical protein